MDGIFLNSFGKGMNSDFAKTIQQKESYLNALNFRITTENGQSTGILSNVKGNTLAVTFPDTSNILEINGFPRLLPASTDITINGTTVIWNIPLEPTFSLILDNLVSFITTSFSSLNISAFNTGTSIVLYSTTFINLTLSFSTSGFTFTEIVAQTNLIPIGSTNIRDEIIILTTSEDNILPDSSGTDGTPNGGLSPNIGQIWKLTYNAAKIDQEPLPANTFTLTLLYNNRLNFSLTHPVAPTAIIGNFENSTTKKIYWCDYFNRMRNFNTADPNGFFLDISLIDSTPDLDTTIPILQSVNNIGTGSLPTGMYQYTYRLLNTQGITTPFSPLSNLVHLVNSSEANADGTPTNIYITDAFASFNTNKSISLKIQGLDTNYDRIQVAFVRRTSLTTVPDVAMVFSEEPIDKTSGIALVTHTGSETLQVTITNDELTNPVRSPDIYKSNAIKDSLLLIANVKTSKLDLSDIFDARAFRYTGINAAGGTPTTYSNADDVNPDQSPISKDNYLYQQDGTTLGGQGTNISYTFVYNDGILETNLDSQANPQAGPAYRNTTKTSNSYNFGIPEQTFPAPASPGPIFFIDPVSPYIETIMKGYQRDETYRFGIVFYDKKGFPGFVQWIGDIRFPSIYMPDLGATDPLDRSLQFPMTKSSGDNYFGLPIGIKFTVDTTLINDKISGYSIVRVKREQGDKTVLANGIIQPAFLTNPLGTPYIALQKPSFVNVVSGSGYDYDKQYASILTAETFFNTFGGISGGLNDYVEVVDTLNSINGTAQAAYGPAVGNIISNSAVLKLYSSIPKTINSTYRGLVGGGAIGKQFQVNNTLVINEFSATPYVYPDGANQIANISPANCYTSQGGKNLTIKFVNSPASPFIEWKNIGYSNSGANFIGNDGLENTANMYLVNYKRNIVNQYGGSTVSQRSRNDYMSCNHYQPVTSGQLLYSSNILGGDVWVQLFDQNDQRKSLIHASANLNTIGSPSAGTNEGTCGGDKNTGILEPKFFICESCININTRSKEGYGPSGLNFPTVNTSYYFNGSPGTQLGLDDHEGNQYNLMFSEENDIQTFFPKPIPFIEQNSFDNRICASNVKINGELSDSWDVFPAGDYKDVDGTWGPINGIIVLDNQLNFLQDRAIGILPVNPRAVLNGAGTTGAQLQLGIGSKLDKHQYISTSSGTKHQWSIQDSPSALYYYDVLAKKMMKYNPGNQTNPLSDIKGLHAFFDRNLTGNFLNHDNPIIGQIAGQIAGGITTVYDFKNNDVLLTFHDSVNVETKTSFTIAYNELADCFTSFYSFKPPIYLTNRQIYLSPSDSASNAIYVHSKGGYSTFYGITYPSTLTTIVNENPLQTKVFDNQVFETEAIGMLGSDPVNINNSIFSTIRMYNDYQNTDFQTLLTDVTVKRRERSFNIAIPRNRVLNTIGGNSADIFTNLGIVPFQTRMRDKYLTCDYSYSNLQGWRFLVHNIQTKYRLSPR